MKSSAPQSIECTQDQLTPEEIEYICLLRDHPERVNLVCQILTQAQQGAGRP